MRLEKPQDRSRPVREALRNATAAIHQRLHETPDFRAIAHGTLPRPDYAVLLRRVFIFHDLLVRASIASPAQFDRRLDLLRADLSYLGADTGPAGASWFPPADEGAALGGLYVAHGSALGGKVIFRQLDYLFGSSTEGRRYYAGSEADKQQWQSLCDRLEDAGREAGAAAGMLTGAQAAFTLFGRCIGGDYDSSPVPLTGGEAKR